MKIKKKREKILFMAAASIAITCSSLVWADVDRPISNYNNKATSSDAVINFPEIDEKTATSSNAEKNPSKTTGQSVVETFPETLNDIPYTVTLTMESPKRLAWGDVLRLRIKTTDIGQVSKTKKLSIRAIDENGKSHIIKELDVLECQNGQEISYQKLDAGTYTIIVWDEESCKQAGNSNIQLTISPTSLDIIMKKPVIYSDDIELTLQIAMRIPEDASVTNANGTSLWEGAIVPFVFKVNGIVPTAPGSYEISAVSSLQIDNVRSISVKSNGNNKLYIPDKKRLITLSKQQIQEEQEIRIDIIQDLYFPKESEINYIQLGTISESNKANFKAEPTINGSVLSFLVQKDAVDFFIELPLSVKLAGYEEQQVILRIEYNGSGYKSLAGVSGHTEEEIRDFFKNHPFDTSKKVSYKMVPDKSSFQAGELSDETVQDGLNALNFMRFIAGLEANVVADREYQKKAQAGAVLLDIRGKGLSHEPEQPSGVPNDFYNLGYLGTSHSNLGMRYRNLSDSIINGYMNDGDSSNIDRVGHRLWCLNRSMRKTGFGFSSLYTAMYAHDGSGISSGSDSIWPGLIMPYEYFKGPWHISLGGRNYQITDKTVVTMKGKTSGRICIIDKNCNDVDGKYMNMGPNFIDSSEDSIIFKPDIKFLSNEEVEIIISGLFNPLNPDEDVKIRYSTKFFSMNSTSGGEGGSTSGGGGSTSGGGGGGSKSTGGTGNAFGGPGVGSGSFTLPDYVIKGTWIQSADGNWKFLDSNGISYINKWAAVQNPYANSALGQSLFDWFFFDSSGNMVTGWYHADDGNLYYMNPASDGTRGKMCTGWVWIPDQNGIQKCYYFNPHSDGTQGKMTKNSVIDGYTVNENGEWAVNGITQTK